DGQDDGEQEGIRQPSVDYVNAAVDDFLKHRIHSPFKICVDSGTVFFPHLCLRINNDPGPSSGTTEERSPQRHHFTIDKKQLQGVK
ncbi:MAG: hypothetical protein IKC65_10375, partial [Lentisphaeria bacterium]|nr:hypothetical protein [Lentisphaeria bacterium]